MREGIAATLKEYAAWLARLRWVGRWEPAALALGCAGTALAAFCGWIYLGAAAGALFLAGHLLALGAVLAAAGRPYTPALLGLCGLSGLHVWLWLMQGLPHGRVIALGYLIEGSACALLALLIAWRNAARWQALAKAQGRDDFRWLLTRAPLLLRWRVARYLAQVVSAG